jgi:antitoxin component of MazEF toxin-antitoxin module
MLTKTVKLRKRGNSLWITIPAEIVRERKLQPGDEALFTQTGEHEFELSRVCSQTGEIKAILTLNRIPPLKVVSNREEANKR